MPWSATIRPTSIRSGRPGETFGPGSIRAAGGDRADPRGLRAGRCIPDADASDGGAAPHGRRRRPGAGATVHRARELHGIPRGVRAVRVRPERAADRPPHRGQRHARSAAAEDCRDARGRDEVLRAEAAALLRVIARYAETDCVTTARADSTRAK